MKKIAMGRPIVRNFSLWTFVWLLTLVLMPGISIVAEGAWKPMDSGTPCHLYGAWGSSDSDVFAVGEHGAIPHYDGFSWSAMNSGTTNPFRKFSLVSGLWEEYIYGSGVYLNMENGEITFSNNIITGNSAEERADASISGTVYESNGDTPISGGGYVDIYNGDPCKFNYLGATPISASDGTYQFNTLPPGTYYLQTYAYEPYLTEWWASPNSMPLCGNAQPIVLASGDALTNMNFQLDPGAIITGTVFESDGTTPVADGGRIYAYSGDPCTSGLIQWGRINVDTGAYSINGLGTGEYYIQAQAYGDYLGVWWAEPKSALSCENAQAISVVAGNTLTGKDFQVAQKATLYVTSNGQCGQDPCYETIQLALEAAEDGSLIKVADGTYLETPNWKKAGTVTISGGWMNSFTKQNGLTEIYNPLSTGGGSLKLQPNVKVIAQ